MKTPFDLKKTLPSKHCTENWYLDDQYSLNGFLKPRKSTFHVSLKWLVYWRWTALVMKIVRDALSLSRQVWDSDQQPFKYFKMFILHRSYYSQQLIASSSTGHTIFTTFIVTNAVYRISVYTSHCNLLLVCQWILSVIKWKLCYRPSDAPEVLSSLDYTAF